MLVDKNARHKTRRPEFELQTFYGQLEHIFVVKLAGTPDLAGTPATMFFAAIKTCNIVARNSLDMHYYEKHGRTEVIDMNCIQCVVGRISDPSGRRWAIIDRSGALARALYMDEQPS